MSHPPRTVADVLAALPPRPGVPLPAPAYAGASGNGCQARVGLAVESMRRHTSAEGFELFAGLEAAGYVLHGHNIGPGLTDVREILRRERPGTVFVQDKREYVGRTAGPGFDRRETFLHAAALADRPDVWRGTLIKDAQHDPDFHRGSAAEIGAHFHVCYYHPAVVARLAPYVRPGHLVRTYHTVNADDVPAYSPDGRDGCLLSGAVSGVYPLRSRLLANAGALYRCTVLRHPGYGRQKCHTPAFLQTLSRFRVAVCTSSVFGYALRKHVEAVACGCTVITDLPADDVLPGVDAALVRVHPSVTLREMSGLVRHHCETYDPERAAHYAAEALRRYDYRVEGRRLAAAIEELRSGYCRVPPVADVLA